MVTIRINKTVKTPHGKGTVQGRWHQSQVLVRVKITQANEKAVKASLTPRAKRSALFAFGRHELGVVG
jgi:hypothetical protein